MDLMPHHTESCGGHAATQEGMEIAQTNTCKPYTVHTWNCCTDSALAVGGIGLRSTK